MYTVSLYIIAQLPNFHYLLVDYKVRKWQLQWWIADFGFISMKKIIFFWENLSDQSMQCILIARMKVNDTESQIFSLELLGGNFFHPELLPIIFFTMDLLKF